MRILVASSSAHRQTFYRGAIEGLGDEVRVAVSGVECAESLRKERPDLLILETPLLWGGSDGVLAVLEEMVGPGPLPVILVAAGFSADNWFQLGRFRLDNFLFHVPTAAELHRAIVAFAARPVAGQDNRTGYAARLIAIGPALPAGVGGGGRDRKLHRWGLKLSEQRARHVLVLAPHPDDETFGCGGTIRMLAESGIAVDVAFMTRGELGADEGPSSSPQQRRELAAVRTKEAQAACDILGVRSVQFLDGADTCLAEQPQMAVAIAQLFRQESYERVFCPWPRDVHADHVATFQLVQRAARDQSAPPQFWLYEVWNPLAANAFVPIDRTVEVKRQAIEQYRSQLSQLNYREGFLGLAAYRSLFCPSSKYAEAFLVCNRAELLHIV